MPNNSNWKAQLQTILSLHNSYHAFRSKLVSHSTMAARAKGLFRAFKTLRELGFQPAPQNLCGTHIEILMQYWTADPALGARLAASQPKVPLRTRALSAAYIQQQLSFLRVFASWIGKPGLVLDAERYVAKPEKVRRHYAARHEHGWTGNGIDVEASIQKVAQLDEYVAAQLRMMMAFGLRRKEAIMFRPHASEVPSYALPATCAAIDRYVSFLRVKRGTKGGRLRYVAIRTEAQRGALAYAQQIARYPTSHLGRPGLTLKQSLDRFSNVVRVAGLTKTVQGVTPHGLRHEFAGDLYFDVSLHHAPVRGGDLCYDRDVIELAYAEVAHQLGHTRSQISSAYLGSAVPDACACEVPGATKSPAAPHI
ncbi:integrase domain-containing protein [Massilia sp. YMA4]|uniref:Integrase domain-containing protein n=1 Tax=[Empedobacter] haloabium TaxID=592317 RepID=A0ABZ1USS8_9BURK|nr:integrase domain-containing protein [Massilia sp. YMA4]AXA91357.1 integrase [Massilia sp. YMA4]